MSDETVEGALLELKLIGDIAGEFRVARYQRGYRWGKLEVERLLSDIWESKGEPYSLQPIVVKRDGEPRGSWSMASSASRRSSSSSCSCNARSSRTPTRHTPSRMTHGQTARFICKSSTQTRADSNIDFFHLYAGLRVHRRLVRRAWCSAPVRGQQVLRVPLRERARHLVRGAEGAGLDDALHAPERRADSAHGRRALQGAVALAQSWRLPRPRTGLTRSRPNGTASSATFSIPTSGRSWQTSTAADSPTRITLLLDTLAGGPRGRARPRFHTFDVLREKVEQSQPEAVWNQVVELHALVLGWYENRDHYHKIGYLVAVGQRFGDLVALASGKTKSAFEAVLDARIRETLDLTPSGVTTLSYETDTPGEMRAPPSLDERRDGAANEGLDRALLVPHPSQRRRWSLEHIHAQHAENLTKAEQWREWLRLHREALADLPSVDEARRDELLRRIDNVGDKIDRQVFQELARDVTAAFTLADASTPATVHSRSFGDEPRAALQRPQQRAEQRRVRGQAAPHPGARPARARTFRSARVRCSSSTTRTRTRSRCTSGAPRTAKPT